MYADSTAKSSHPRRALIGREAELTEIEDALGASGRVVVVCGMGGIGKSTLARAVLARAGEAGETTLDVWLEDVSGADGFVDALVGALGMELASLSTQARLTRVAARLGMFPASLVLLDAFETVIDTAHPLLERLSTLVPDARFLVTSREELALPLATRFRLGPLETEASHGLSPAARLFVERAGIGKTASAPRTARLVEQIVCEVDGIPLAVEFVASQARVSPLKSIAAALGDGSNSLAGVARGRSRQRTLEAVIQWSYTQLEPIAQRALCMLSVIRGRFGLDDVRAVLDLPSMEAVGQLQHLLAVSLVHQEQAGDGALAFRLLAPIATFARRMLDDSKLRDEAVDRYADWLLNGLCADDLRVSRAYGDDIRAFTARIPGLDWLIENHPDPVARVRAALRRICTVDRLPLPARCRKLLAEVVAQLDDVASEPRARRLYHLVEIKQAYLSVDLNEPDACDTHIERARCYLTKPDEARWPIIEALYEAVSAYLRPAAQQQQIEPDRLRNARQTALEMGDLYLATRCATWENGWLNQLQGMPRSEDPPDMWARALACGDEAVALAKSCGNEYLMTMTRLNRMIDRSIWDDAAGAAADGECAIELAERLGLAATQFRALTISGLQAHVAGHLAEAQRLFEQAANLLPRMDHERHLAENAVYHAYLLHELDQKAAADVWYQRTIERTLWPMHRQRAEWGRYFLSEESEAETGATEGSTPAPLSPGPAYDPLLAWWQKAKTDSPMEPCPACPARWLPVRIFWRLAQVSAHRIASSDSLVISPNAIRTPDGQWVSTRRHRVTRRLIDVLVDAHEASPGVALSADSLIRATWPEERRPDSASSQNRLYVQLSRARKLGMAHHLERDDSGWRLSTTIRVVRRPDPPLE